MENEINEQSRFISLLVTPQTSRASLINYPPCLSHGLTKQVLGFSLIISPSPVICLIKSQGQ